MALKKYRIVATGEVVAQNKLGAHFPNTAANWNKDLAPELVDFLGLEEVLVIPPSQTDVMTAAVAKKLADINRWREEANWTSFTYAGKLISCDRLSRGDIDGVNGSVTLTGAFPPGFPNAWKTEDNSYVPIPDIATWKLFYMSMVSQGSLNFMRSEQLKAIVNDPEVTLEQLEALTWVPAPPEEEEPPQEDPIEGE